MQTLYWLSPTAFCCEDNGHCIMLDIRKDQYYLIERDDWTIISPFIAKLQTPHVGHCSASPEKVQKLVQTLICRGLLTPDGRQGKPLVYCKPHPPNSLFEQIECDTPPSIRWYHPISIFFVGIFAQFLLTCIPLRIIIKLIKSGKRGSTTYTDNYIHAARVFQHLRPFLPKSTVCLYDSLSFFFFCRLHGLRPDVVIGIRAEPFAAHCWTQIEGIILNDVPANILQYRPIMLI